MSWNNLRLDQLKQILAAVGLPITGGKIALLERLSSQNIQQHVDRVVALSLRGALSAVVRAKSFSPVEDKRQNGTLKDRIMGYEKDEYRDAAGGNSPSPVTAIQHFDEKDEDEDDEDDIVNVVPVVRNRAHIVPVVRNRAQDLQRVPRLPPMMGNDKRLSTNNSLPIVATTMNTPGHLGNIGSKKRPRVDTVGEGKKKSFGKRSYLSTPPPTFQKTQGPLRTTLNKSSPASVVLPNRVEEPRNGNVVIATTNPPTPTPSIDHECLDITPEYLAQEHAKRMSFIRREYSRYTGKDDDVAVRIAPKHWEKPGYVVLRVSPPGSQEPIFIRVTRESPNARLMALCASLLGLSISNLEFWAYGGFGKDSVGIKMRNSDRVRNFVSSKRSADVVKVFIRKRHSKGKIRIFVKTPADKILTYCIGECERIETVKMRIQLEEGIPPEQQVIVFNGQPLEPGRTLNDYNVANESTLHVVQHKKEESITRMSLY